MDVATNWTGLEASGSAECFNFSLMSTLTKPNWHEQPRKIKWTAKKRYWSTRASGLGGVAGGSWWLIQILNTWIRLYLAFKLFKLTNAHTHSSQSYKTGCQGVCHAHMSLFFFFPLLFPAFPFMRVGTRRNKLSGFRKGNNKERNKIGNYLFWHLRIRK